LGDDRDLCAAILEIEDGIRRVSLRKERFPGHQFHDFPPQASMGEEGGGIKCRLFELNHLNASLPDAVWCEALRGPQLHHLQANSEIAAPGTNYRQYCTIPWYRKLLI
jgi:hypothetical protein